MTNLLVSVVMFMPTFCVGVSNVQLGDKVKNKKPCWLSNVSILITPPEKISLKNIVFMPPVQYKYL